MRWLALSALLTGAVVRAAGWAGAPVSAYRIGARDPAEAGSAAAARTKMDAKTVTWLRCQVRAIGMCR
jgi:uncharacterized protein (UPF0333 family)